MEKFNYPNLLGISIKLATIADFFDHSSENLANLLDWMENEDFGEERKIIVPVKIIITQLFNSLLKEKSDLKSFREEFPNMCVTEWNKLNDKFNDFIDKIDDLKLNDDKW